MILVSLLLNLCLIEIAKLLIFGNISKKYFAVVHAEDAAVADSAALTGGKYLYVAPAAIEIVSQRDTISEFQDRAVGFPHRNIDRVAGV